MENFGGKTFKVRGYVTRVKWWTFKVYSISTRLHVNNLFFLIKYFYFIFFFKIWRHLATNDIAWQPLPINRSSLLCIHRLHFLCHIRVIFTVNDDAFERYNCFLWVGELLFYSRNVFCNKFPNKWWSHEKGRQEKYFRY